MMLRLWSFFYSCLSLHLIASLFFFRCAISMHSNNKRNRLVEDDSAIREEFFDWKIAEEENWANKKQHVNYLSSWWQSIANKVSSPCAVIRRHGNFFTSTAQRSDELDISAPCVQPVPIFRFNNGSTTWCNWRWKLHSEASLLREFIGLWSERFFCENSTNKSFAPTASENIEIQ